MKFQEAKARMPKMRMSAPTQEMFQSMFFVLVVATVAIGLAFALCSLIGWPGLPITLFALLAYLAFGPLKE